MRRAQAASSRARRSTSTSMSGVRRPVNVFCWLGWYEPTTRVRPDARLRPVAEPRPRPRVVAASPRRSPATPPPSRTRRAATSTRTSREQRELPGEERRAVVALRGEWLVRRRRAADRGRDVGVAELEPVVRPPAGRLVRQPDRVHRREQEVAGRIAGEHAPGPVAAVRRRRQADDQDPRLGVAEARARAGPSTSRRGTGRPSPGRRARATRRAAGSGGSATISAVSAASAARRSTAASATYFSSSLSSRRDTTSSPAMPMSAR